MSKESKKHQEVVKEAGRIVNVMLTGLYHSKREKKAYLLAVAKFDKLVRIFVKALKEADKLAEPIKPIKEV